MSFASDAHIVAQGRSGRGSTLDISGQQLRSSLSTTRRLNIRDTLVLKGCCLESLTGNLLSDDTVRLILHKYEMVQPC